MTPMMVTGASSPTSSQVVTQRLILRPLVGIRTGTLRTGMPVQLSCSVVGSTFMQVFAAPMNSWQAWKRQRISLLLSKRALRVRAALCVVSSITGWLLPSVVYPCCQQARTILILRLSLVLRPTLRCGTSSSRTSKQHLTCSTGNLWTDSMAVLPRVWLLLIWAMPICGKPTV